MEMKIFSIQDKVADFFMNPFHCRTIGEAERTFTNAVSTLDVNNLMSKHPDNFALYYVGEFNEATGVITPRNPELIGHGSSYVNQGNVK